MTRLMGLVFLLSSLFFGCVLSSSKPVSIRDKATGQLVTSSLLTWESFNPNGDEKQFENAVAGGHFTGADKQPVYICRSTIDGVPVTGLIIKRQDDRTICIVSLHTNVRTKPDFDILLNKGNGAKLEWHEWEKLIPFTQSFDGAVSSVSGGSRSETYYIGRHNISHKTGHNEIDHAIGYFNPSAELGKIYAIHENNEKTYESGEVLVAIEAARYEIYDIKFKSLKLKETKNLTLLGQTTLKNEGSEESDVNAVIGYEHEIVRNFGTHEGIARSVNTTVYMSKTETFSFFWGIQKSEKVMSSKTVGTRLKPGTAVNVTLWANYTTKEGAYDGQLVVHYVDGTKSKKKRFTVNSGFEASLDDPLNIEYSETYWIHNDTVVPTTTKRTTTTSSTTTHRSVFPIVSNDISITEKSKSLESQNTNSNNLVELSDDEIREDEMKNDINSSTTIKVAIILVIGSLLTSF